MRRTLWDGSDGSLRRVPTTVKRLEYAVSLDSAGTARSDPGGEPLRGAEEWSAEHLVLAGLCRCTVTSLRYHARRINVRATAEASASGIVTKRESDGRYAFVEVDVELDVVLDPSLAGAELQELIGKAERDCFVGASLIAPPRYRRTGEGEELR